MKLESRLLVPEETRIALVRDGKEDPLAVGQDATLSPRGELDGSIDAPMVFIGYGLSLPEANWDDFAGVDLKGKVAVYVNAFPPATVSDNVKSHVNTADQRWLALKRAGAIGVATITPPRPPAAAGASPTPTPTPSAEPAAAGAPGTGGGGGRGRTRRRRAAADHHAGRSRSGGFGRRAAVDRR